MVNQTIGMPFSIWLFWKQCFELSVLFRWQARLWDAGERICRSHFQEIQNQWRSNQIHSRKTIDYIIFNISKSNSYLGKLWNPMKNHFTHKIDVYSNELLFARMDTILLANGLWAAMATHRAERVKRQKLTKNQPKTSLQISKRWNNMLTTIF